MRSTVISRYPQASEKKERERVAHEFNPSRARLARGALARLLGLALARDDLKLLVFLAAVEAVELLAERVELGRAMRLRTRRELLALLVALARVLGRRRAREPRVSERALQLAQL